MKHLVRFVYMLDRPRAQEVGHTDIAMAQPESTRKPPARRGRGRPAGGGNTAEQAQVALMDAAERSILSRGFRASTMEIIAREAGYSRAAIYRHFPSRQHLLKALVARKTAKHQSEIGARLSQYSG